MDAMSLQRRIRALLEPTVEGLGYDLVAVEWTGDRSGRVLRLSIDGAEGIGADDCARVSNQVSPLLDTEDPIPTRYHLEVSSPGIDRPVQRREDFERFQGYRISLKLVEGPPRRRYVGALGPLEGDEVVVTVDGADHRIPLDLIERAHLVLDLEEYQKLGGGAP
ncbi:MAG: ribosome maturation factor RimP [Myxococcota bacterium]